ncbi:MAG: PH domain-containing protein [Actinobacteria bacterium]|nr:PH domain-containing protein [Actinomycetota bacterium]
MIDLLVWLPRMWPVFLVAVAQSWGIVAVATGVVVLLATRVVAWWRTTYAFDGAELTVAGGVWNRTVRRVPVARLQQVEVVRKLRHQALGVSRLRLQLANAGSDDGDVLLDVLSVADAEALKSALEQFRREAVAGVSSATAIPPPPAHELLRLDPKLLALGGVTGASLLLLPAALVAALQVLDDVGLDDDAGEVAQRLPVVGFAVAAVILSFVIAATLAALRNHRFRLSRRSADLVIERGLLEQRATTVPIARVQLVRLHRNVLRRWLGLASVDIATSGRSTSDGAGSADDSVPVARWDDAIAVSLVALGGREVVAADRAAASVAVDRLVRRRLLIAVALTGWLPILDSGARGVVAVAVVALLVVVGLVARASGRSRRHGIGPDVVVVEAGALAWSRALVPIDRVQSWRTSQSPFQRRHDLHHVHIHLSGRRHVVVRDATGAQAAAVVAAVRRTEHVEIAR